MKPGSRVFHKRFGKGVVRSVEDGETIFREVLSADEGRALKDQAGLTLSVHPSGNYFAYPHEDRVRFKSIATGEEAPSDLTPTVGSPDAAPPFGTDAAPVVPAAQPAAPAKAKPALSTTHLRDAPRY